MAGLDRGGDRTAIFELQGSLFFGTTDQLYKALEQDLKTSTYLILDMRRVQSVDVTAAHLLQQIEETLAERNAYLLFSDLPSKGPSGQDMRRHLDQARRAGVGRGPDSRRGAAGASRRGAAGAARHRAVPRPQGRNAGRARNLHGTAFLQGRGENLRAGRRRRRAPTHP